MLPTSPIPVLIEAINQGDNALFPLVDAMLEAGDPLAEGVRWLAENGKWPDVSDWKSGVLADWWQERCSRPESCRLPDRISIWLNRPTARYKSIHQAIIAAAEAVLKSAEHIKQRDQMAGNRLQMRRERRPRQR